MMIKKLSLLIEVCSSGIVCPLQQDNIVILESWNFLINQNSNWFSCNAEEKVRVTKASVINKKFALWCGLYVAFGRDCTTWRQVSRGLHSQLVFIHTFNPWNTEALTRKLTINNTNILKMSVWSLLSHSLFKNWIFIAPWPPWSAYH